MRDEKKSWKFSSRFSLTFLMSFSTLLCEQFFRSSTLVIFTEKTLDHIINSISRQVLDISIKFLLQINLCVYVNIIWHDKKIHGREGEIFLTSMNHFSDVLIYWHQVKAVVSGIVKYFLIKFATNWIILWYYQNNTSCLSYVGHLAFIMACAWGNFNFSLFLAKTFLSFSSSFCFRNFSVYI